MADAIKAMRKIIMRPAILPASSFEGVKPACFHDILYIYRR